MYKTISLIAVLLLLLISLSACATGGLPTIERVVKATTIEHDAYAKTWKIITPKYYGGNYHVIFRCGGKGKTPDYFQIYVITSTDKWYYLDKALDIEGNKFPVRKISSDVSSYNYVTVHESVAIDVPWTYLKQFKDKPIKMKLYGKGGNIEIEVDPAIPTGFLQVVDKHLGI